MLPQGPASQAHAASPSSDPLLLYPCPSMAPPMLRIRSIVFLQDRISSMLQLLALLQPLVLAGAWPSPAAGPLHLWFFPPGTLSHSEPLIFTLPLQRSLPRCPLAREAPPLSHLLVVLPAHCPALWFCQHLHYLKTHTSLPEAESRFQKSRALSGTCMAVS